MNPTFSFSRFVLAVLLFDAAARGETNILAPFSVSNAQSYVQAQSENFTNQAGIGADTYYMLARLQNRLGHQDEAERLGRLALRYDITRADIQSFMGRIYTAEGRFEDAANSFRKALLFDAKNSETYRQLGMVLDQSGDHEGALKAVSKGIELNPSDAAGQLVLGRLLLDRGNAAEALGHLEKSCQLDPTSVNSFYVLAQAQTQTGNTAAAAETTKTFQRLRAGEKKDLIAQDASYDDQTQIRRTVAGFHTDAAELFLAQGKDDLAESHLKEAINIASDDERAYDILAEMYLKNNALTPARETYEKLAQLHPDHAIDRVRVGAIDVKLKDYPAAIAEFKKALEIDPKEPEALKDLVRVYLGTRRELPQALELSRRCATVQPTAANYDLLAQAAYLNKQIGEARTASAQALRLDPANPLYLEHDRRFNKKP